MKNSIGELLEAELELGKDAGICDPDSPEGGLEVRLRRRKVHVQPWKYATEQPESTVNIISSKLAKIFYDLKHTIFFAHGMPEYSFYQQLKENVTSWSTAMNMPIWCDATFVWSEHAKQFWGALDARFEVLERGVDLKFWKPEGEKFNFDLQPNIAFLEIFRHVKSALTYLFAMKYVHDKIPSARGQLGCMMQEESLMWMMAMTKLDLDMVIQTFLVGVHPEPWKYYRNMDMVVSPTHGGLISRVGAEALACGCPVIILEGSDNLVASAKCRDKPLSMADAILKLWDKIREDPEKSRRDARKIAEDNYDIVRTAKRLIEVSEELVGE